MAVRAERQTLERGAGRKRALLSAAHVPEMGVVAAGGDDGAPIRAEGGVINDLAMYEGPRAFERLEVGRAPEPHGAVATSAEEGQAIGAKGDGLATGGMERA